MQFVKIITNLFTNITTMDISEPLTTTTLEMIEKTICSIKKLSEINIENKEFKEIVNDILEVLVVIRDQKINKQSMFNQDQWTKKPIVNLITDTIAKSEVCILFL